MTAPVVGSKSCPARMARVEKSCWSVKVLLSWGGFETRRFAALLNPRWFLTAQECQQVVAGDDRGGLAVVDHEQCVGGDERLTSGGDRLVHTDQTERRADEFRECIGELRAP